MIELDYFYIFVICDFYRNISITRSIPMKNGRKKNRENLFMDLMMNEKKKKNQMKKTNMMLTMTLWFLMGMFSNISKKFNFAIFYNIDFIYLFFF